MEKETVSKRDAIRYLPWTSRRNIMETSIFRILKYSPETHVRGNFRLYFSETASALKASGVRKYRGEFVLNALSQIYGLPPVCKSVHEIPLPRPGNKPFSGQIKKLFHREGSPDETAGKRRNPPA